MLNLSTESWSLAVFQSIGNTLGCFEKVDMSFMESILTRVAHILVMVNFRDEFPKSIVFQKGVQKHTLTLNYVDVPFKCNRCHKHGHLVVDYTLFL